MGLASLGIWVSCVSEPFLFFFFFFLLVESGYLSAAYPHPKQ